MMRQMWHAGLLLGLLLVEASGLGDPAHRWPDLPKLTTVRTLASSPELQTIQGRNLYLLRFAAKDDNGRPTPATHKFLIQGGLHGNETETTAFVIWLARRYARGESPLNRLASSGVAFDFLPSANPDGSREKSRYNARGVNLNRNFGVLFGMTVENAGPNSFSEPETRAIDYLLKTENYTGAVDIHGYINWIITPSTPASISRNGHKTSPSKVKVYRDWISALNENMKILPGYVMRSAAQLGDGGAFEDWAFWKQDTLSFCLEMISQERFTPSRPSSLVDVMTEGQQTKVKRVDLFKRYEEFIATMFKAAIRIRRDRKLEMAAH